MKQLYWFGAWRYKLKEQLVVRVQLRRGPPHRSPGFQLKNIFIAQAWVRLGRQGEGWEISILTSFFFCRLIFYWCFPLDEPSGKPEDKEDQSRHTLEIWPQGSEHRTEEVGERSGRQVLSPPFFYLRYSLLLVHPPTAFPPIECFQSFPFCSDFTCFAKLSLIILFLIMSIWLILATWHFASAPGAKGG